MRLQRLILLALAFWTPLGTTAQIRVVDDLGRSVSVPEPAQRIVSLAPSLTETLFAIGAGDAVAGVTSYCTYPAAAAKKPKVGGMVNPNLEAIVALRPDLIVLSMEGNVREDFDRLTALGVPVFVSNPRSLAGIRTSIQQLGALTGRAGAAGELSHKLAAQEDEIIRGVSGPKARTLLIVSIHPLIVAGGRTFLNELLVAAGAVNLAARFPSTYPTLSREAVVSEDPDLILVASDVVADTRLLFNEFPEWKTLKAAERNSIYRFDADLVSRPGPRSVEALRLIAQLVRGGTP